MLGNTLFFNFANNNKFQVRGSIRKILKQKTSRYHQIIDENIDLRKINNLKKKISDFKPNVVINCAGWIKQKKTSKKDALYLNKEFPLRLDNYLKKKNIKLIHFSTDCVFDGRKGNYEIIDKSNAKDLYGYSKSQGEIISKNCLVIRTSIIGHEIKTSHGLLEWFLKQQKFCDGYSNVFFSGISTFEVYKFLEKILKSKVKIDGLYHLVSKKISKYHLLCKIKKIYKKKIIIKKNSTIKIDRSLSGFLSQKKFKYVATNWNKMIREMKKNKSNFNIF